VSAVHAYHDGTKHNFHRFARSLGYLDWASQPNPFRSFAGAPIIPLPPRPDAAASDEAAILNPQSAVRNPQSAILRYSLGLSAWKRFGVTRWSLRVNPSSGNLHPTEAYVVAGPAAGLGETAGVYHYAPDRHVLERRCSFDAAAWRAGGMQADSWLIVLTSIHWREAWKYGERAFRYCQHDMGHAIAAIRFAAALAGWGAALLPEWSHAEIASLTGIDRDEDFFEAEREEPGCLLLLTNRSTSSSIDLPTPVRSALVRTAHGGKWTGRASQLSEDHITWSFIDQIAMATRDPGHPSLSSHPHPDPPADPARPAPAAPIYPGSLMLQRRSAVALDGSSSTDATTFLALLSRVMPQPAAPWDALWWPPRIHLAVFVHRVNQIDPGLYLLARESSAVDRLRRACGREFLWERVSQTLPLFLLERGDCRSLAARLSCDQDIAADGFFSLGMLAEFDASVNEFGPSFYRHLFWEAGIVGQVLYLEAEAAGARATGIGCYFDDPVHQVLGITDHSFQSLYHFTVGTPIEDARLTTSPGYEWESR
jgi:SagB-type dehydrogenase family enzyme